MTVVHFPVDADSKYVRLMMTAIPETYSVEYLNKPDLRPLIRRSRAGETLILHVHWEERALTRCGSAAEAAEVAARLSEQLTTLRRRGGRIVWTVHNGVPHRMPFLEAFLTLRQAVAKACHVVLVHDRASIDFLEEQIDLPPDKARVLPHPSSLGVYEPEEATLAAIGSPVERTVLAFGAIRDQKGFDELIEALPQAFLEERGARIRIAGVGKDAQALRARHAHRTDVVFDTRYVPDDEVPALLRSAACVALPYRRLLTSGVAHLAMTYGAVMVAPDVPQFRELLPEDGRDLLFRGGDPEDLRRAVDAALALTPATRADLARALVRRAQETHPLIISRQLIAIYDELTAPAPTPRWRSLTRALRARARPGA